MTECLINIGCQMRLEHILICGHQDFHVAFYSIHC